MRRTALIGCALAALAAGCGGGSERAAGPPVAERPAEGAPAPAAAQVTDGRLGESVVARPGKTTVTGGVRRIPPAGALPPSGGKGVGAEERCRDADLQPTSANLAHVSDVILCLMNAMRENAGMPALKENELLAQASVDHSQDMVDNKFFAHDSQDGRDVVARLKAVAYIPIDAEWIVGENLVWGSGGMATPRALVQAWMDSKPHRENLISGDFVEVGMGPVIGTPSEEARDGITVTTDFGTRFTGDLPGTATESSPSAGTAAGPARVTPSRAARRRAALRKCSKRRGAAKRRCVRAARKIR